MLFKELSPKGSRAGVVSAVYMFVKGDQELAKLYRPEGEKWRLELSAGALHREKGRVREFDKWADAREWLIDRAA